MNEAAPRDAGSKLRMVLDYVPCEACLAHPVPEPEQLLLCGICRRLDRQVGVRVAVRTTVLLERPAPPEPVVIEPPTRAAIPPPDESAVSYDLPEPPVRLHFLEPGRHAPKRAKEEGVHVYLSPVEEAPPTPPPAPAPAEAPAQADVEWEDIASWKPHDDDLYSTTSGVPLAPAPEPARAPPAPPERLREPEPEPELARAPEAMPEDDYVFRPPPVDEAPAQPEPEMVPDDWMPAEEVPVEPETREASPWSKPVEEVEEPAPVATPEAEPEPVEEEVVESSPVEEEILDAAVVEEEVLESTPVDEEPILESSVVDEPAAASPADASDLWRLRGFDADAERALAAQDVAQLSHLSGRDAGDLAKRTGLSVERLRAWIHVADLVTEVGVPVDASLALVAAGIEGPRGLADADADEVVERAAAFAGASLNVRDVKRWKRRA